MQDLESINLNEASISREQELIAKQREMAVARAVSTDVAGFRGQSPHNLPNKMSAQGDTMIRPLANKTAMSPKT